MTEAKILHNIFVENSIENHPLEIQVGEMRANVHLIIYKKSF